jgi:Mor family transcriptional regulator
VAAESQLLSKLRAAIAAWCRADGLGCERAERGIEFVEGRLRRALGGSQHYLPAQSFEERNRMVLRDFNATADRDLVCARHGISRATFYRILKGDPAEERGPDGRGRST